MIGYNIMVLVEILTRCSYETLTAKFVQVVKIRLFMVVSNSYAKITFLPKRPLLTYVYHLLYVVTCCYSNAMYAPYTVKTLALRGLE